MSSQSSRKATPSPFYEWESSRVWFYATSFGAMSAGMLGGFYYTLRREGVKSLSVQTHGTPAMVATRALFYGTVLCVGTFAGLGSAFVATTGISSFREFHDAATKQTSKVEFLTKEPEETTKEKILVRKMDENEEMSYFWGKLGGDAEKDEKRAEGEKDNKT